MQTVSIIIPAHNEERRIKRTLEQYAQYFAQKPAIDLELIVVLNGCTDDTFEVVQAEQKKYPIIRVIDEPLSGKGRAVKIGFLDALSRNRNIIGFVDADMATDPERFNQLITQLSNHDGVIASRYMKGAHVYPSRPFIKRWGRSMIYNSMIKLLFGLWYADLQCGAKLFKRHVVKVIAPRITITQWAFDVELLYLCKRYGFTVKEVPTVWYDQLDSKLRLLHSGLRMLGSVIELRIVYSPFNCFMKQEER